MYFVLQSKGVIVYLRGPFRKVDLHLLFILDVHKNLFSLPMWHTVVVDPDQ